MPEISIIVPVYKVEKYLDRCVKSILDQTFTDFELILVDDGSPDNCPAMCDEWAKKDARIKVIHKENGGAGHTRNVGLENATGKYIGFVDADDWITKDMYQYLYTLIIENNVDVSMCDFTRNPKELEEGTSGENIRIFDDKEMQDFFYRINGEPSYYAIWNRLYKREILSEIHFLEGKITEDVMFIYEVTKNAKSMVFSNKKKYLYFENAFGVTKSKLNPKDLALLEIWDEIVSREKESEYSYWAEMNRKRATFTLYVKALLSGYEDNIKKSIVNEWRQELKGNYSDLMGTKFFDWKRKILLFYICKMLK